MEPELFRPGRCLKLVLDPGFLDRLGQGAAAIGVSIPPNFVLRPSDKPHRNSKKMIVATMARVITSVTAFVSTMSTASASRPRQPAPTNRERFNLLTATTRLTNIVAPECTESDRALVRHLPDPRGTTLGDAAPPGPSEDGGSLDP